MTFVIVRIFLLALEPIIESDINDFRVVFYTFEPDVFAECIYKDIPNFFNCKVHAFEIDLDRKLMYIKSEVVKHGKI